MCVFIQCQFVVTLSIPWSRKIISGKRLTKNAVLTAVLTCVLAHSGFFGFGSSVVSRGSIRIVRTKMSEDDIIKVVEFIASTWICTKSFWFLRPMDELLSFRSVRKPRILTAVHKD